MVELQPVTFYVSRTEWECEYEVHVNYRHNSPTLHMTIRGYTTDKSKVKLWNRFRSDTKWCVKVMFGVVALSDLQVNSLRYLAEREIATNLESPIA